MHDSSVSTRELILQTARRMFNEHGYRAVTMRALANELGIGVGNVTYYFACKHDIVDALMDEPMAALEVAPPVCTFEQIHALFSFMLETLKRDSFYFLDPEFQTEARHLENHGRLAAMIREGLANLTQAGYFREDFTEETRETLLRLLLMSHLTWMHSTVRGAPLPTMDTDAFLRAHWLVFSPYFTPKGAEAWKRMAREEEALQ